MWTMSASDKARLEAIAAIVARFDRMCEADEHTDVQDTWDVLHWIRAHALGNEEGYDPTS